MNKDKVIILLATYNGDRYVKEQIESIQGQDFKDWILIIRDDGSTDETVSKISALAVCDKRILILSDQLGNLGVIKNFNKLIEAALQHKADYVFFADQDDIWQPSKVSKQLSFMKSLENKGSSIPTLIHTNLEVVDSKLCRIHPSLMAYQKIQHEMVNPLAVLMVQNFVTGCTVLVNKELLSFAYPIPKNVVMHDWWLAMCSATVGRLVYMSESLILYRQHEQNTVGAQSFFSVLLKKNWITGWQEGTQLIYRTIRQVECLIDRLKRLNGLYNSSKLITLEKFVQLMNVPLRQRFKILWETSVHRQTFIGTLFLYIHVIFLRKNKDSSKREQDS